MLGNAAVGELATKACASVFVLCFAGVNLICPAKTPTIKRLIAAIPVFQRIEFLN